MKCKNQLFIVKLIAFRFVSLLYSSGIKDALSEKDQLYNKLVEVFFKGQALDFAQASDNAYFVKASVISPKILV